MKLQLSDFDLCELVYDSIDEIHGYDDIIDGKIELTEEERTVFYIWGVGGFIDTNGFVGLWSLSPDYRKLTDSLSLIGKENQASVVSKSLELFKPKAPPVDGLELVDFFGSEEKAQKSAEPFQKEYWSFGEHEKALAEYIRINSEKLHIHLNEA